MIAPTSMALLTPHVAQSGRGLLRLSDLLRDEAALDMTDLLDGVSGKRIQWAAVPGASVTYLSRCTNGGACNPLFRLASLLILMKRLGLGRERAQRLVDRLQELVNQIWGDEPPPFEEVMGQESDLDAADDPLQTRAILGDSDALREWIRCKRESRAYDAVAIRSAECRLAEMTSTEGE